MSFKEALFGATGLDSQYRVLPDGVRVDKERLHYLNSGTWIPKDLALDELGFDTLHEKGEDIFFKPGVRMNPTILRMPPHCTDQGPHCHPGGELSLVLKGSYYDADMAGRAMRGYGPGEVVVYGVGSTHRPLSSTGANIFYVPFDGILFGNNAEELTAKMKRANTPLEAMRYAVHWMVPEAAERDSLLKKLEL